MTRRAERLRTLLVGPIGERPWLSMDALAESLVSLGHNVIVNGEPDKVLPMLRPLPARLGVVANSAPVTAAWFVQMFLRWRRRARRSLRRAGVDHVLVWDPVLALLCCAARPRGVEVLWIAPSTAGALRRRDRMIHAALRRFANPVVSVPPTLPDGDRLVDGWVVLGSASEPSAESLDRLEAHAAGVGQAAALVFDARLHETATRRSVELLCKAAQPLAVWWCGDDEWVQRLGGVPAEVIDPSDALAVDHRHLRALAAGATLLASHDGAASDLLVTASHPSGWQHVTLRHDAGLLTAEHSWAATVFGVTDA